MNIAIKPRVLVIEDEAALLALLRYNLEKENYTVDEAMDGEQALLKVAEHMPDLILLDWMLPRLSGLEVCRQLRRDPNARNVPIIMLTARGEEADRVRGLDAGADDYIAKPFSPSELLARIRAVLRRIRPALAEEVLTYGGLVMDVATHKVTRNGRVLSRDQLLDAVWGRDIYVEQRTVDVHIRRLRKALNGNNEADVIRTVRSAGYALELTATPAMSA
jgi:two-component system phosphate regulon response regulator PhoB